MNGYTLCVEVYNGKGTVGTNREVVGCPICGNVRPLIEKQGYGLICAVCADGIDKAMDSFEDLFTVIVDDGDLHQYDTENYQQQIKGDMLAEWETEWGYPPF